MTYGASLEYGKRHFWEDFPDEAIAMPADLAAQLPKEY